MLCYMRTVKEIRLCILRHARGIIVAGYTALPGDVSAPPADRLFRMAPPAIHVKTSHITVIESDQTFRDNGFRYVVTEKAARRPPAGFLLLRGQRLE